MSWLGSGLSQITGQISTFTKEVLTEGTEEIQDHATELKLARSKIQELENQCALHKKEVEKIASVNEELNEKLESAELQLNSQSGEYRAQLEQKQTEIQHLKSQHNDFQSDQLTNISLDSAHDYHHGFVGEEDEFGDVIRSQHEINRLRHEVQRLERECQQWKVQAESSTGQTSSGQSGEVSNGSDLQARIKELEEDVQKEVDQHQDELAALQDLHVQKLSQLKKKHKLDLEQAQAQVEELKDVQEKVTHLEKVNSRLTSDLEQTYAADREKARQLEELQAEIAQSGGHQSKKDEQRLNAALMDHSPEVEKKHDEASKHRILQLENEVSSLHSELNSSKQEIEDFDLVRSDWQMEKEALEEVLLKLRSQIREPGNVSAPQTEDDAEIVDLRQKLDHLNTSLDAKTESTGLLENKVKEQHLEIEELKKEKVSLENEKLTLEKDRTTVVSERDDLFSSKASLSQENISLRSEIENLKVENQKSSGQVALLAKENEGLLQEKQTLLSQKTELEQQVAATQQELGPTHGNEGNSSKEDELVEERNAAIEEKVKAQAANERLKSEILQLQNNLEELDSEHDSAIQQVIESRDSLSTELKKMEQLKEEMTHSAAMEKEKRTETESKLEKAAVALNNLHMDKQELQEQLENKKKQILELQDEQQDLQRRNAELLQKSLSQHETDSLQNTSNVEHTEHLEQEIERLMTEMTRKESDFQNKESNLKTELDQVKVEIEKQNVNIDDLSYQIKELNTQLIKAEERHKIVSQDKEQVTVLLTQKEEELTSLLTKNSQANQSLQVLNVRVQEQEEELGKLSETEKTRSDSVQQLQSVTSELQAVQEKLREAEENNAKTENDSKPLEFIYGLEKQITELTCQLEEKDKLISQGKHDFDRLKKDVVIFQQKADESNCKLEEWKAAVHQQQEAINVLQQQLLSVSANSKEEKFKHTSPIENGENSHPDEVNNKESSETGEETERINSRSMGVPVIGDPVEANQLRNLINLKDDVIKELKDSNDALMKILEERSQELYGDNTLLEIHRLENEVKLLRTQKEQIMSVLNEKTRECSSMKGEVHRLMNVISAEKAALSKLQKDNQALLNAKPKEDPNSEMTKEAVQNLSRIIRDRDLEVEALTQKNNTLLAVLQEGSPSGSEVGTLLQEKDNLIKQLGFMQTEREQMFLALTQKHQESVAYHQEIQRLNEVHDSLQHEYSKLAQQFESKQKALLKSQNELLNYKQKHSDSVQMSSRSSSMLSLDNPDDSADNTSQVTEDLKMNLHKQCELVQAKEKLLEEKEQELSEKDKVILDKDKLLYEKQQKLQEKERSIAELNTNVRKLEQTKSQKDAEFSTLKKQLDNTIFQMQGLQTELNDTSKEHEKQSTIYQQSQSQLTALEEQMVLMKAQVNEKEFELNAVKEKNNTLGSLVQKQGGAEKGEMDLVMKETEALQKQAQTFQQERDTATHALHQVHSQKQQLLSQIAQLTEKEAKLQRELERLRSHLLQIEEGYTMEALAAEEREKELRNRLAVAEEKALSHSNAIHTSNQQASVLVESLQQQLEAVTEQRDNLAMQLASTQETSSQYAASLSNLQMVLEQFQHERGVQQAAEVERWQKQLRVCKSENDELKNQLTKLQNELQETQEGLEAAHRLSEQLDRKDQAIQALRDEVQLREDELKKVEEKCVQLSNKAQANVDKLLVKSLILGYFHTPANKRNEVIALMAKVLDFSQNEIEQACTEAAGGSWLPRFLRKSPSKQTPPSTPVRTAAEKSFSEMFVNFLERESSPAPEMRLPAEEMAKEQQLKQQHKSKPLFNPFATPIISTTPPNASSVVNPIPLRVGQAASGSPLTHPAQDDSHILMKPMVSSWPTFMPVTSSEDGGSVSSSGRSTPANASAILRDVLQQ